MSKREILLKIESARVWFNSVDFIDISDTDIPHSHLAFRSARPIYWKVKMIEFDADNDQLTVDILDYSAKDAAAFLKQKPKKAIRSIVFGTFDWRYLEPLLSFYQLNKFSDLLTHSDEDRPPPDPEFGRRRATGKKAGSAQKTTTIEHRQSESGETEKVFKFSEKFAVKFSESTFMLGYVAISEYIDQLGREIEFKIENDHILPEFDAIKFWFAKSLKSKKIRVKAFFTMVNGELQDYRATSREIDQIDQNLIEGVKMQRTLQITKTERPGDVDQSLFTSDDLYMLDDKNDLEGNVFRQTEKDILDMLLENGKVRNRKELIYLSGAKQSHNYRIRFTNHPYFGFIFLAEGAENNHFIWELLNSHATYIWTVEKDARAVGLQYKRIESSINTVLESGRENYKRAYTTAGQDDDLIFNVINHADKGSDLIDEFPKWKHRVNALIT